jgi:tape measure domain-containing protein
MAETIGNLLVKIGADVSSLTQGAAETQTIMRRVESSVRGSTGAFSQFQASVISVNQGLQLLRTGASAVTGIGQAFFAQADAASQLSAQIRLVTGSQEEALAVQQQLLGVANSTRTGIAATATFYSRLARASTDLGVSQSDLLRVTQTINESLVIGGASAAEAASGMLQLSQALGAGVLRGDELNSVLESMPTVAGILAGALNVPIGKLKQLAETGAITSKVVVQALLGASSSVDASFAKIPITAEQAFTVLSNEALKAVGDIDRATGATAALVQAIEGVRGIAVAALPPLVEGMKTAGAAAGGLAKSISENRSVVFNEMAIAIGGMGAALGGAALQSEKFALAVGAVSRIGAAISPTTLLVITFSAAVGLAVGQMADWAREASKAADTQGNLAVAIARARARGIELTQAQRAAILNGKDLNTVLAGTAAALNSTGTAAQQTAAQLSAVGTAISAAVQKAQTDVAIFGTAVGTMATGTSAAFKSMAAGIAAATGAIPAVPSESFVTLTQNINRSALAMTSLAAQSATLISQMQTLDTTTETGAATFAKLDAQLAKVRENANIIFTSDFGDLTTGLTELQDAIAEGVDPIQIRTDAESLRAMGQSIIEQVKATNDKGLIAEITLAVEKFNQQLDSTLKGAETKFDEFSDRLKFKPPIGIPLRPQFELEQLTAELATLRSRIVDTKDTELKMKLKGDAAELEKLIAEKRAEIAEGETLPIKGDASDVDAKLTNIEQRIQSITFGFGQITGNAATGADIQNTIDRLRDDLVAAIKAGDTAAQARLKGGAEQFIRTFQPTGGITASEVAQIRSIIGPLVGVSTLQLPTPSFGGRDPAIAAAMSAMSQKQQEANTQSRTNAAEQTGALREINARLDAGATLTRENTRILVTQSDAAVRTATATETIAKTLTTGGFGAVATTAVNQNVARTTGVRGGGIA